MKDFVKVTDFELKLDRDNVFHLIDCYPDNPVYEDVIMEFEDVAEEALKCIKPVAFYKFGQMSEEVFLQIEEIDDCHVPVIYCLLSIGDEITELASSYFQKGDYLVGMIINAIADTYLFQMDTFFQAKISEDCKHRHVGIARRLDAPVDMPMCIQKSILEEIKEFESLTMDVTSGFMYTTVKTTGYILVLSEDESQNNGKHDCSKCNAKNCKMRKTPSIKDNES